MRLLLLQHWDPAPPKAAFTPRETANLQAMWREVAAVASVGAWRAMTALCGQLMEAHLKQRLLLAGEPRSTVAASMLHRLIGTAVDKGLLSIDEGALSLAGSVSTARQLRNWASHGSAWQDGPSEGDASRALVLLICFSGWIFSRDVGVTGPDPVDGPDDVRVEDDGWWEQHVARATAGQASARLGHVLSRGDAAEVELRSLCDRIITDGSPASVMNVLNRLAAHPSGPAILSWVMHERFASVVGNAGRGRARQVVELAGRCWTLGYTGQARALRSCLPRDGAALGYFLQRSPRTFVTYLAAVRDADPAGLAQLLSRPADRQPVVQALADRLEDETTGIKVICQVAALMPRALVRELLEQPQLTRCTTERPAWELVHLLRLMSTKHLLGPDHPASTRLLSTLVARARTESPELYSSVPRQLHESRLEPTPQLLALARTVLQGVAERGHDWPAQQILWDLAQYFPQLRPEVEVVAAELLGGRAADWSPWSRLCLAGAVRCFGLAAPDPAPSDVDAAVREPRQHRWELLRVVLACTAGGPDLRGRAQPLLDAAQVLLGTTTSSTELSEQLLADVRCALEAPSPVA